MRRHEHGQTPEVVERRAVVDVVVAETTFVGHASTERMSLIAYLHWETQMALHVG
jgi:hypothetical protein